MTFFLIGAATTEIYTLSLHDALPILPSGSETWGKVSENRTIYGDLVVMIDVAAFMITIGTLDRKSTRLNSSHPSISYAVFCLKKKTQRVAVTRRPQT